MSTSFLINFDSLQRYSIQLICYRIILKSVDNLPRREKSGFRVSNRRGWQVPGTAREQIPAKKK
jgi:hypothetical protein